MLHAALLFAVAIDCTGDFFQNSWALLQTASYGQSVYERAAFAVRDADDRVTFVRWPSDHRQLGARYKGPIPPHTFAIVHTHPNGHPLPSADDEATAARLGIAVYVLTINSITRWRVSSRVGAVSMHSPSRMMVTRSAMAKTSCNRWLTKITPVVSLVASMRL